MDIEEAEEYYKKYLGHGFHMCREEPGRYEYFKRVDISKEHYIQWDTDLLNNEFENMWIDQSRVWVHHRNIIDIIRRGNCKKEDFTSRLLDEMEKMNCLSLGEITLIIENMAGRTYKLDDGGVYVICKKTKQGNRMVQIMNELIQNIKIKDQRYQQAVERYKSACSRYWHK